MRRLVAILILLASACTSQPVPQPTALSATATAIQTARPAAPTTAPSDTPASPTASPSPAPEPTNPPVTLTQLTDGGCCTQPFWSSDSSQVLFLDKPTTESAAGFYGVGLQGGQPQLIFDRLGLFNSDFSLRAFLQNGQTFVEQVSTGERWTIQSGGRAVSFSADGQQVAWTAGQPGPPFDTAARDVWVSQVNGSQPQRLLTVYGGGFSGWLPDGRMLVSGRQNTQDSGQVLSIYDPAQDTLTELARAFRLRSTALSPGGSWLAYVAAFDEDNTQNGLWLVNVSSGERRRLETFGAFRWRDDGRLLVIPLDVTSSQHTIFQVEAATGQIERLPDPVVENGTAARLRIANNDWSVSPDGHWVALVSANDHNIWLMRLP